MSPPPIRYPLPSLVAAILLGCAVWSGQGILRKAASALATPVRRVVNGPDYPSSKAPKVGPLGIARKVLLMKDDLPARSKPGGETIETFGRRGFADVFDAWPSEAKPTDLRIGSGQIVGWVGVNDVLRWETRLVLRWPAGTIRRSETPRGPASIESNVDGAPLAITGWQDGWLEVTTWKPGKPWAEVERSGWLPSEGLSPDIWGVLLTDSEIVALRRASRKANSATDADRLRIRAILGMVLDDRPIGEIEAIRSNLPPETFAIRSAEPNRSIDAPSEVAASWGGLTFRAIPLSGLP